MRILSICFRQLDNCVQHGTVTIQHPLLSHESEEMRVGDGIRECASEGVACSLTLKLQGCRESASLEVPTWAVSGLKVKASYVVV